MPRGLWELQWQWKRKQRSNSFHPLSLPPSLPLSFLLRPPSSLPPKLSSSLPSHPDPSIHSSKKPRLQYTGSGAVGVTWSTPAEKNWDEARTALTPGQVDVRIRLVVPMDARWGIAWFYTDAGSFTNVRFLNAKRPNSPKPSTFD